MTPNLASVEAEYAKDKNLKNQDVISLLEWCNKQQHLPNINELQAILFLQSCYYGNEAAKTAIEGYFTVKTRCPYLFKGRDPSLLATILDNNLVVVLPKRTPEGYKVILGRLMATDPENFDMAKAFKHFDMCVTLDLYQEGTCEGYVIALDLTNFGFMHLTKVIVAGTAVMGNFLFYLQEALPVRLKGFHFFNTGSIIDKLMGVLKPFLKKPLLDILYLDKNVEELTKFVPIECLPKDYGGEAERCAKLQELMKKLLSENVDCFAWEDAQNVDESKRTSEVSFGIQGTFKKMDID